MMGVVLYSPLIIHIQQKNSIKMMNDPKQLIPFQLEEAQMNKVVNILAKEPFIEVYEIIGALQLQAANFATAQRKEQEIGEAVETPTKEPED